MGTSSQLSSKLHSLDGKSYGALKQLSGRWDFEGFTLYIDKVQSDPYAPPSKIRLIVPLVHTKVPAELLAEATDRVAVTDFIARDVADAVTHGPCEFRAVHPGQEILDRSSVTVDGKNLQVVLSFQFPAAGRRVKGKLASSLLVDDLPDLMTYSALGERLDEAALRQHVETYRDFLWVQRELSSQKLVGFVADGGVLPRASGDSDTPLPHAVPFTSPAQGRVTFDLPSGRSVSGLGIKAGITLLVGGGFHGKSTLLRALERGVYAHIPGDGRELVVCDPTAISIRAEDGRAVIGTDISAMINNLPSGIDTQHFSTPNASGSTSQAANLAEALEIGAHTLLIDEDTSATNFMIRDDRMKQLISAEPITPLVERITQLWDNRGISTVLVMGGSGEFFEKAHTVIALNEYVPEDVTERAHKIAHDFKSPQVEGAETTVSSTVQSLGAPRFIQARSLTSGDARKPPRARGLEQIQIGKEDLDLRYLSQLVDSSQTQAIALSLNLVAEQIQRNHLPLVEAVQAVVAEIESAGFDALTGGGARSRGDLAAPRAAELHQAISRWRRLKLSEHGE